MPWWLIVIGTIALAILGVLALSVRLRLIFEENRRLVGLTLGRRTGLEIDFLSRVATLRLAGLPLRRINLSAEKEAPVDTEPKPTPGPELKAEKARRASRRKRRFAEIRDLAPHIFRAVRNYLKGLYRATTFEEFGGRVEAGFDSPDRTGMAFGYYQALLGVGPTLLGRVEFVPVWSGPSFSAAGRLVLALPLYRLLWRTAILVWQLPLRRIIKLART